MVIVSNRNILNSNILDENNFVIHQVSELIRRAAGTNTTVLIQGESGTAKELVARSVHYLSKRNVNHFVPINCNAIPKVLLESELFGHVKGAFKGAIDNRKGRFELAEGGTLFIDEISELDLNAQAKLLQVLQEKVFEPVGSTKSIQADVRVVASTCRNLEEMVHNGKFIEDLFNCLREFLINMPPLQRAEDLTDLVFAITKNIELDTEKKLNVAPDAMEILTRYRWPANIKEISNLLNRLKVLYPDTSIDANIIQNKYDIFKKSTHHIKALKDV